MCETLVVVVTGISIDVVCLSVCVPSISVLTLIPTDSVVCQFLHSQLVVAVISTDISCSRSVSLSFKFIVLEIIFVYLSSSHLLIS